MKKRLKNETDEKIVIEPGESIDIFGEEESVRLMTARRSVIKIEETEKR